MFRKLMLAGLIAAGAAAGLSLTPAAAVAGYDHDHGHGRFRVLVRHHGHWDVHGTYRDRDEANRVARQLERHGRDAKVERVR